MPRHLFSSAAVLLLLLCVLLICGGSGVALAEGPRRDTRVVFEEHRTKVPYSVTGSSTAAAEGLGFYAPSLAEVDGLVVAVAQATLDHGSGFVPAEAVARTLERSGVREWVAAAPTAGDEGAEGQIAVPHTGQRGGLRIERPTMLVKDKTLFLLTGAVNSTSARSSARNAGTQWELLLTVGAVQEAEGAQKRVVWQPPASLTAALAAQPDAETLDRFIGGGGAGIVMEDNTLVFPVQAQTKLGHTASMVIYSRDNGATWSVSRRVSVRDCGDPAVFQWDGKLLLVTRCGDGRRELYESGDLGANWRPVGGPLASLWSRPVTRTARGVQGGFVTATIGKTPVLLFTLPVSVEGRGKAAQLHLWVADRRNLADVGPISDPVSNAGSSALLYTKDGLFSLHERGQGSSTSVFLKDLGAELQRVNSVVAAWEMLGAQPSRFRLSSYLDYPSSNRTCRPAGPTNGLVGVLSDNASDDYWENDLQREGAAVTKALKFPCGLRLQGRGARALWTVATMPETAEYQFTNNEFTLLVTAVIHNPLYGRIPLLSVGLAAEGRKRLLGLAYTTHRHWMVRYGHMSYLASLKWEPHKRYHVALTLRDGKGFVYLDGKPLPGGGTSVERSNDSSSRLYITFGPHWGPEARWQTDTTVASVMLYNRSLSEEEIAALHSGMETVEKVIDERLAAEESRGANTSAAEVRDNLTRAKVDSSGARAASKATRGTGAPAVRNEEITAVHSGMETVEKAIEERSAAEKSRGAKAPAVEVLDNLTRAKVDSRGARAASMATRETGAPGVGEAEEDEKSPRTAGGAAQPPRRGFATSWAVFGDSSVQVCGGQALLLLLLGLSALAALC